MELGNKLARLREERDRTQDELAQEMNVSRSTISSYENGTSQPSYAVLVQLADYFDVSLDYLFDRTAYKAGTRLLENKLQGEKAAMVLDDLFALPPRDKELVIHMVEALTDHRKYQKLLKNKKA